MLSSSFYLVLGFTTSAVLLGWTYFRRYEIQRPPIGVFNLGDVAAMIGAIVVVPYLYLALPLWLVVGIFALAISSILYFTVEPVVRTRWAVAARRPRAVVRPRRAPRPFAWLAVIAASSLRIGSRLGSAILPWAIIAWARARRSAAR